MWQGSAGTGTGRDSLRQDEAWDFQELRAQHAAAKSHVPLLNRDKYTSCQGRGTSLVALDYCSGRSSLPARAELPPRCLFHRRSLIFAYPLMHPQALMFDFSAHRWATAVCCTNHAIFLFSIFLAPAVWKGNRRYCKGISSPPGSLHQSWSQQLGLSKALVFQLCSQVLSKALLAVPFWFYCQCERKELCRHRVDFQVTALLCMLCPSSKREAVGYQGRVFPNKLLKMQDLYF